MIQELIGRLTNPGLVIPVMVLMIPIIAILKGGRRRRYEGAEENRLAQEIYAQLERMEKRVESLEAILMERIDGRPRRK